MTTTTRNETAVALNADRAADAEKAILAFACVKEGDTHEALDQTQQTPEEWLIDILTDLRHWARVNNLDFAKTVDITARHFEGEVADELEPDPTLAKEKSDRCPKCGHHPLDYDGDAGLVDDGYSYDVTCPACGFEGTEVYPFRSPEYYAATGERVLPAPVPPVDDNAAEGGEVA